jgi:hypothetical protein
MGFYLIERFYALLDLCVLFIFFIIRIYIFFLLFFSLYFYFILNHVYLIAYGNKFSLKKKKIVYFPMYFFEFNIICVQFVLKYYSYHTNNIKDLC